MTTEVLTGEIVEVAPQQGATLFQTDDPAEVLARAHNIAEVLKGAIAKHIIKVGRSEHLMIEAWTTVGSTLGISPYVVWSKPLPAGNGWEARAEARTVDGRTVGAAEAMVTREERNWTKAEDYAMRSMAQTRAMSKALRGPLSFIVTLAGYSPTPAEEVTPDMAAAAADVKPWPAWAQPVPDVGKVAAQLVTILRAGGVEKPGDDVNRIGQQLMDMCNGTIPFCVLSTLKQITEALDAHQAPPAPEPSDAPASE